MNHIHDSFIHGDNFNHGFNIIIEEDVIIGGDVKLGHNVTLKSGTRIMNDIVLGDYVKTTGICIIGNSVSIRTGACVSKSVIINDNVFLGPGVMTNHTRNVMHKRNLREVGLITSIGYGSIIGSGTSIVAGVSIGDNVVISAGSNVYNNIQKPGVYGGNPAAIIEDISQEMLLKKPDDYMEYEFDVNLLKQYFPKWEGFEI